MHLHIRAHFYGFSLELVMQYFDILKTTIHPSLPSAFFFFFFSEKNALTSMLFLQKNAHKSNVKKTKLQKKLFPFQLYKDALNFILIHCGYALKTCAKKTQNSHYIVIYCNKAYKSSTQRIFY